DFLHGGAGDDAISGAESLTVSYIQDYKPDCTNVQQLDACVDGVVETDWYHPWNPGDILHFGADTNPWLSNHHIQARLGEFLLYNEYDPRRAILFNSDGTVWSCQAVSNSGHQCTDTGGPAPAAKAVLPHQRRRRRLPGEVRQRGRQPGQLPGVLRPRGAGRPDQGPRPQRRQRPHLRRPWQRLARRGDEPQREQAGRLGCRRLA